jgi:hypothetical protein
MRTICMSSTRVLAVVGALALFAVASAGLRTQSAAALGLGNKCTGILHFRGDSSEALTLVHESKWATDSWVTRPPHEIRDGASGLWATEGGTFRGCHNEVKYHVNCPPDGCRGGLPFLAKLTFSETFHWDLTDSPQYHCAPMNDPFANSFTTCYAAHEVMADNGLAGEVAISWSARQWDS